MAAAVHTATTKNLLASGSRRSGSIAPTRSHPAGSRASNQKRLIPHSGRLYSDKGMKTLLLSIPLGMSVRNILRSEIFTILRQRCRVIILSPYSENRHFREEFAAPNVEFGPYPRLRAPLLSAFLRVNYWGFWLERRPPTMDIQARGLLQERGPLAYHGWMTVARLWNTLRRSTLLRDGVERAMLRAPMFRDLRHRFNADGVFTVTHAVLHDIVLMVEAKRQGLPVAVMVHSWDNLPCKGRLFVCPDRLLVWNHIMAEQGRRLHDIPPERISVTGLPQYDGYLGLPRLSRAAYLRQLKIGSSETALITYTCNPEWSAPDEPDFLEELVEIVGSGVWGQATLVIRLHPTERREQYRQRFGTRPCVRISEPDPSFAATWASVAHEPLPDGRSEFVNLMAHSDVVINLASTTTIDAALFDTPVVNVAYNPTLHRDRWNYALEFYSSSHFKDIVATGGTRLARSKDELVRHVTDYLTDPKLDAGGRERIRREQCDRLDHQSGQRVAACVLDMIGVPHDLSRATEFPELATVRA